MIRSTFRSAFFNPRVLVGLILCAAGGSSIVSGTLFAFFYPEAPTKDAKRTLALAERVAYQRAIEAVYWRHRIWPKESPNAKPSLDAVISESQLENKVADYLRNSQALEDYWHRPITAEQLQAEMNRMVKNTKQPDVLRELFQTLGNDPFVIAECLARPALAERLLTDWYAFDERIHGELKKRVQVELQAHSTLEQMKQTSGTYAEIELVKSEDGESEDNVGEFEHRLKLKSNEWDTQIQQLAAMFDLRKDGAGGGVGNPEVARQNAVTIKPRRNGSDDAGAQLAQIRAGAFSPLQEDKDHFYATAVIERTGTRIKLATVAWLKEGSDSWLRKTANQEPNMPQGANVSYTLPEILDNGCADDTWAASSMNVPDGGSGHTAVWTGSEMIVWGGENEFAIFGTGGRYDPSTDTWTATSLNNNPSPRTFHTAVWTGSEMIVWGGGVPRLNVFNTGGRYNPSSNSWTATSTTNAPSSRSRHTAVWTGSEMIVWGGVNYQVTNTGGKYNPSTNTWTAASTTNAPAARFEHTAVWTGSEMIVWGGFDLPNFVSFDTGGRYNPSTNTWSATNTANAPIGRHDHTAVWTGSEMIIWGGLHEAPYIRDHLNTGSRYRPSANSWTATSTTSAPVRRQRHTAIWTGSDMIIWGGEADDQGNLNTGARYHPDANSWTAISTTNAPSRQAAHTAIWTDAEMIIFGGGSNSGGRYNPGTDMWVRMNGNAPDARWYHTGIWTGSEMIVWGGTGAIGNIHYLNTGGQYHPGTDSWTSTSLLNAPSVRAYHTAVWSGTQMIAWGGFDGFNYVNSGGRYNPTTNSWAVTSTSNAPPPLSSNTSVWTGSEMIIWGEHCGVPCNPVSAGGRYNPTANSWAAVNTVNAPSPRRGHTALWTGSAMVVWGGSNYNESQSFNTGGRYSPSTNTWVTTSTLNAPAPRELHTAVWSGSEMIVWGGYFRDSTEHWVNTGGRYNPRTDAWVATTNINAPTPRSIHSAVWTGSEMIVWGGSNGDIGYPYDLNTGGRYKPSTNSWTPTSVLNAPLFRRLPTAVWTGSEMIVWGGFSVATSEMSTGGRYCAVSEPIPIRAAIADFNGDGSPDYVLSNLNDRRTAILYLNNNVYIGSVYGPTLPGSWHLRGVADFNLDTHPDYALFVPNNNQTVIAYLSGPTVIGAAYGPTLPHDWELVTTADLNGDTYPDYVLYNPSTRQTQVFYLNNNVSVGAGFGPTLPLHWTLVGVADFNSDGYADYLLFNMDTGQTVIVYLSGLTVVGAAYGPTLPSAWPVVATADFNGDGSPDYLVYKADTRQTAILYLQNNAYVGAALGPSIPAGWSLLMQ